MRTHLYHHKWINEWDNNNTTGIAFTSLLWFISWKKGWKKYDIPEYLQHIRKRWSLISRSFEGSFRTVYLQNDISTHSHLYNMWETHVTVSRFQNTQVDPILIAFYFKMFCFFIYAPLWPQGEVRAVLLGRPSEELQAGVHLQSSPLITSPPETTAKQLTTLYIVRWTCK